MTNKAIVFYITSHGYGHAARNIAILEKIVEKFNDINIYVKSDMKRCRFIDFNLKACNLYLVDDSVETGIILKKGSLEVDKNNLEKELIKSIEHLDINIYNEAKFLKKVNATLVISDINICGIAAANKIGIPSMLITNFIWSENYRDLNIKKIVCDEYENIYRLCDKVLLYDFHQKNLESIFNDFKTISLISRRVNKEFVNHLRNNFKKPIVFLTLGASAELNKPIDVSRIPFTFIYTCGLQIVGKNVLKLPPNTINTPDYIHASSYIIAKGGWSTVSEVVLAKKNSAFLFRNELSEDNTIRDGILEKRLAVSIDSFRLNDIMSIIKEIDCCSHENFSFFYDSLQDIVNEISECIDA